MGSDVVGDTGGDEIKVDAIQEALTLLGDLASSPFVRDAEKRARLELAKLRLRVVHYSGRTADAEADNAELRSMLKAMQEGRNYALVEARHLQDEIERLKKRLEKHGQDQKRIAEVEAVLSRNGCGATTTKTNTTMTASGGQ